MENKLIGKKIKNVFYMDDAEAQAFGWYSKPLVIELEDGSLLVPQRDDEGNDGGALYYLDGQSSVDDYVFGVQR